MTQIIELHNEPPTEPGPYIVKTLGADRPYFVRIRTSHGDEPWNDKRQMGLCAECTFLADSIFKGAQWSRRLEFRLTVTL